MPRYFTERGKSHQEVLERIRSKYGDTARIMMEKNVPVNGIMGLFGKEQVEYTGYIATGAEAREVQKSRDDEQRAAILAAVGKSPSENGNLGTQNASGDLSTVLAELRDLKGQLAISASAPPPEPFPVLTELAEILRDNDFDTEYIDDLMAALRREKTAEELENRENIHRSAGEWIAESFSVYHHPPVRSPRVFVLVGPTGVGKTTTIAKLAAVNGLSTGQKADVRIITIDSFRIGARAQVETYGEIMGIPVMAVDSHEELRKQMALASEADLILVDTIGKSPRDIMKIAEMRELLKACGERAEVHLALSSTTKTADMKEILRQFEPFGYKSVILTKLDETSRVGNLISLLSSAGRPVSYLTDGQSVPVDIAQASQSRLLSRIKGLDFDKKALEERYPSADLTAAWR